MNYGLRAVLLLVLITIGLKGRSQTLHFIVFADTDDTSIGGNNLKTYSALTGEMGLAHTIAGYAGLTPVISGFYGARCRAAELDKALNELTVRPDDVVFFYFVGHGFNSRQNEYPSLILGKANADPATLDASARNLRDLYGRIRAKQPRLAIVVGESCNKERTDPPVKITSTRPIDVMPPNNANAERFRGLFRNWRGGVLLSSSSRNQFSHSDAKGGWMSVSFRNVINELCSANQKSQLDWTVLLDDVVKRTETIAQQNGQEQTPQFEVDLLPTAAGLTKPVDHVAKSEADAPCASPDRFVNEIALAGIHEDMPLLQDMYNSITTQNAEEYAESFSRFYVNQKPFYDNLNRMLFNRIGDLPPRCQQEFGQQTAWIKTSTDEINERYAVIQKYAQKPTQLVHQARSDLPSIIRRLEEILEKLDK